MKQFFLLVVTMVVLASCQHTYYVVRHAERGQTPPQDPPLTEHGEAMAQNLKTILQSKKIKHIYATNFKRTMATAEPLSQAIGVTPEVYGPRPDSAFIQKLKALKHNTLVVGHSNTIDEIINGLCNETKINGDLSDDDYGGLYVITVKGKKVYFKKLSY